MPGESLTDMEQRVSTVASGATYAAGGAAVAAGLTASEWAAIAGAVCAFATFAVNWYYKHKAYVLARQGVKTDE